VTPHLDAVAELRIAVFRDWPYLYAGDREYEKNYLATYAQSPESLFVLAFDAWGDAPNSQHIWNPATGTLVGVPLSTNLFCAGHILLPDGRTMVVGGNVQADVGIKDASIFDSSTNTWTRGADMSVARWYPTATVMGDGRVFVFAGDNIVDQGLPYSPTYFKEASQNSLPSIYNPSTNTWQDLTSSKLTTALYPYLFQLSDGRILDAGPDITTRTMNPPPNAPLGKKTLRPCSSRLNKTPAKNSVRLMNKLL